MPGKLVWFGMPARDAARTQDSYGSLFRSQFRDAHMPGGNSFSLYRDDSPVQAAS